MAWPTCQVALLGPQGRRSVPAALRRFERDLSGTLGRSRIPEAAVTGGSDRTSHSPQRRGDSPLADRRRM